MSETSDPRSKNEIIYHFDIDRHSLPLKQFVDTARSTQSILDDFNEQLFDGEVRYDLRVKSSEPGGLIEILELVVLVGGPVWAFLCTDIGKAYFRGLTGQEPAFWAEKLGVNTRRLLSGEGDDETHVSHLPANQDGTEEPTSRLTFENPGLDTELLAELIIRFLEANIDKLEKIGFTRAKFRKAFAARNTIFRACIDNPEVKGLSFDRSDDFPLKRSDFPRYIAQISEEEREEPKLPDSWSVEIVDILVNSPNWKRDGRKWQAQTEKFKDIAFSLEDETFWHHVHVRDIQPDIQDNMRVQWAYPAGLPKPSHVRVLKVLSYNGQEISKPLSEEKLKAMLEEAHVLEPEIPTLFDQNFRNRPTDRSDDDGGEE